MSDFRWLRIDTAAIMFSCLSTGKWGRTFRFSAYFREDIDPHYVEIACRELMPDFPSVYAYLRRGFFWNYIALTDLMPEIREETSEGILPVAYRNDRTPDFRLTYKGKRLSIECSHSLGDGAGMLHYFTALLKRYNELKKGTATEYVRQENVEENTKNSFAAYYDGGEKANDTHEKAYHFREKYIKGYTKLLFAEMSTAQVIQRAREKGLTVTEYLTGILMLGIIRAHNTPMNEPVTVAVPVNLRRFFPSETVRNFTVQSFVTFNPGGRADISLDDIFEGTRGQLRAQTKKEELQKTVNKYGALVTNPVVRIVPNFIKQRVMKKIQLDTHAGVTTILTNTGACTLDESLCPDIEKLQFVNGDTRGYGLAVTCSCISYKDVLSLCFSRANKDTVLYDACMKVLREEGIQVTTDVIEGISAGKRPVTEKRSTPFSAEKLRAVFNTRI